MKKRKREERGKEGAQGLTVQPLGLWNHSWHISIKPGRRIKCKPVDLKMDPIENIKRKL